MVVGFLPPSVEDKAYRLPFELGLFEEQRVNTRKLISPPFSDLVKKKELLTNKEIRTYKDFNGLRLVSDEQRYDAIQKRIIAEGNVKAFFNGRLIFADRLELDSRFKTLFARGSVRLLKGKQYFQASILRYNFIENLGELEDVYGVIELKTIQKDLSNKAIPLRSLFGTFSKSIPNDEGNDQSLASSRIEINEIPISLEMSCPLDWGKKPLGYSYRNKKNSSIINETAFPPPIGCREREHFIYSHSETLNEQLEDITMGEFSNLKPYLNLNDLDSKVSSEFKNDKKIVSKNPHVDQNIGPIALKNELTFEKRFGVPSSVRNVGEKNKFGAIRVAQLTRQGRKKLITGAITRWRVQASKIKLNQFGWNANRMSFTNDPFTPTQSRFEAIDVIAEENSNGDFLITARTNHLVLEEKLRFPFITRRRLRRKKEFENRWTIGIDSRDRDGLFIGRRLKPIEIANNYELVLQPQFLIQRAFNGSTNSYVKPGTSTYSQNIYQDASLADLFGLDAELTGKLKTWDVDLNANISTFNLDNYIEGSRYWGGLSNNFDSKLFGPFGVKVFGAYRYRAWNGSLGETDIYSAYGVYSDKKGAFSLGQVKSNYLLRGGFGKYQAESDDGESISSLWRANIYGSLSFIYPLWQGKVARLSPRYAYRYSPTPIRPGLDLITNITSSFSAYDDGRKLNVISLSSGPSLTLGTFSNKFLDYTKFSITLGGKVKSGKSPFDFDQAVDLGTLGLGLTQQIVGPLLFNTGLEINIDSSSKDYGELINSRFELSWQRRSYDFGLYYNPYKGIGGVRLRLNDFKFSGQGRPFVPLESS